MGTAESSIVSLFFNWGNVRIGTRGKDLNALCPLAPGTHPATSLAEQRTFDMVCRGPR